METSVIRCANNVTWNFQVDGQKYVGQGRSKKIARIQAADAALRNFIQFKDGAALTPMIKTSTNMDFTSDEHIENGEIHALSFNLNDTLILDWFIFRCQ